jgi:hypothetical protein
MKTYGEWRYSSTTSALEGKTTKSSITIVGLDVFTTVAMSRF